MFELITTPVKLRIARGKLALEEYEMATKLLQEANNVVEDEDAKDWILVSSQKKLTEQDLSTMRGQAFNFYHKNLHARGLIRTFVKFVIGRGVTVNAVDENEAVQAHWDNFWRMNRMQKRQKEIVTRAFRDGEVFLRYFTNKRDGTVKIRFLEPSQIRDPSGKISHGIETDPDDIETPEYYYYAADPDPYPEDVERYSGELKEKIPADEVQHIKIFCDSNEKRGRSLLTVAMEYLQKYKGWLNDRIVLNKVRTAVALIKKITGSPARVSTLAGANKTTKTGSVEHQKMLKAGTVITANQGVDYNFISPKLDARDVKEDGRHILLAIAAGEGIPEYMLTGDASNANYSSTMVAESPGVREFEDWQEFFRGEFEIMYRKVIQAGIDCGDIPEKSKRTEEYVEDGEVKVRNVPVPTSLECEVDFPTLIHRDIEKESKSFLIHEERGWASPETIAGKLGYDYRKEQDKIVRARAREEGDKGFEKQRAAQLKQDEEDEEAE